MRPELYKQLEIEINESTDLPSLLQNLHKLLRLARQRNDERLKEIHRAEEEARIKGLKSLKPQAILYCRSSGPLLGESVRKIKDGKTFMLVAGLGKQWRVPYVFLQLNPVDPTVIKLTNVLSDRL